MSSHFGKFKNIETGEIVGANCIDDYFGKREYGYIVEQEGVYTKDAFFKKYSCLSYDEYQAEKAPIHLFNGN